MSILAKIVRGLPAHLDPLALVEDLPWELAGRRVARLPHTIWQLVAHCNYWMDLELRCFEGPEIPYPEDPEASWSSAEGPADREAWLLQVALFRTNLDQFVTLADARASTLARIVHPARGTTVEDVIIVVAAHNSYHGGQIAQLRRALGAWPPADTKLAW
jgi:hypothetical protein